MSSDREWMSFINRAVTPYHCAEFLRRELVSAGFAEVSLAAPWELRPGAYTAKGPGGAHFAWVIGEDAKPGDGVAIELAHTDAPCLHIKPAGEAGSYYALADTDIYGGPILNTWLDRPLGVAGRVFVRKKARVSTRVSGSAKTAAAKTAGDSGAVKNAFAVTGSAMQVGGTAHTSEYLVSSDGPVMTIPNLAIHFNRDVNKGVELKKAIDLRPVAGFSMEKNWLAEYVASLAGVRAADVVESELYLYVTQPAEIVGVRGDMVSSPRLDNQTSCYALLTAIKKAAKRGRGLSIAMWFDNEEVGSQTRQGADSALAPMLLAKIYDGLGWPAARINEAVFAGRCLSLDVAHALHPNHPEKYDEPNSARFGDGVTLKVSANQRYTYSAELIAEMRERLDAAKIPYAVHTNQSDVVGGSTMGPLLSSQLPMATLDAGVPILAMHSACELMAASDMKALTGLAELFFE